MIYGGFAICVLLPTMRPRSRHLLRGPARNRAIPKGISPGRTLYECRATNLPSTKVAAPGIHLSRSRCHLRSDTHARAAAASPFTAAGQVSHDTQEPLARRHPYPRTQT